MRICLNKWEEAGNNVALHYDNGETILVRKTDFNRAFGAIINADFADVKRDFAIDKVQPKITRWDFSDDDKVALDYENGKTLFVRKADFNRAFGAIINAGFEAVKRDFAIA